VGLQTNEWNWKTRLNRFWREGCCVTTFENSRRAELDENESILTSVKSHVIADEKQCALLEYGRRWASCVERICGGIDGFKAPSGCLRFTQKEIGIECRDRLGARKILPRGMKAHWYSQFSPFVKEIEKFLPGLSLSKY